MGKSIAIIETSAVSSAELKALCREMMSEVTVYEIIDSSLLEEVKANGGPTRRCAAGCSNTMKSPQGWVWMQY